MLMESMTYTLAEKADDFKALSFKKRVHYYKALLDDLHILYTKYNYSHNDINPNNIMMTKDFQDETNVLKIIDSSFASPGNKKTNGGSSPRYMSPEFFIRTKPIDVQQEIDIYSIGFIILSFEVPNFSTFKQPESCYIKGKYNSKPCLENIHELILSIFDLDYDVYFQNNEILNELRKKKPEEYVYS